MAKTYVLTENVKNRLKTLHKHELACYRCGKPIEVGDEVKSLQKTRSSFKAYHKDCWEKMFM